MAFRGGVKSAKQIAAAKRNIVKAQAASARARRGRKRSSTSGHTYGTKRSGRKAAKRALYGSRRHGISPTQHMRRRQRTRNKIGRAAGSVALTVGTTAALYYATSSPQNRANINRKAAGYGRRVKRSGKAANSGYKIGRMSGFGRRKSVGLGARLGREQFKFGF